MDQPKHIVCMEHVEGHVAEFGDLDLAIERAKELCTHHAATFVLSPVAHFRRQPAGRLVEETVSIDQSVGERQIASDRVVAARQKGRMGGPTTEEMRSRG